jgi:hypothetical protein
MHDVAAHGAQFSSFQNVFVFHACAGFEDASFAMACYNKALADGFCGCVQVVAPAPGLAHAMLVCRVNEMSGVLSWPMSRIA